MTRDKLSLTDFGIAESTSRVSHFGTIASVFRSMTQRMQNICRPYVWWNGKTASTTGGDGGMYCEI